MGEQVARGEGIDMEIIDWMRFSEDDPKGSKKVAEDIILENKYQLPEDMKGLKVLDLGANIGAFTVAALERGAEVVAVEPEGRNFETLLDNVEQWTYSWGGVVEWDVS